MTALHLDRMTWAEVKAEIQNGRDTVVVPFGSTEQHGRHLPLGTDAVLGDEIGCSLRGMGNIVDACSQVRPDKDGSGHRGICG